MDKHEYKIKREEIKKLAEEKEYKKALEIVDSINWNKVKSVEMLTLVGRIYKYNRCYEECLAIQMILHNRNPQSRFTIYSICEIYTKLERVVEAYEYYKKFCQIAPNDKSSYILLYNIYQAQEVSEEERIALLEEYIQKEQGVDEKWYYELAYLYHKIGLATQCVEACDYLIVLFGTGRYVMKAMELKMQHEDLSQSQQAKYDYSKEKAKKRRKRKDEMDIQIKQVDVGEYNTTNLQQEIAANIQELFPTEEVGEEEMVVNESGMPNQIKREVFIEDTALNTELGEEEKIDTAVDVEEQRRQEIVQEMLAPLLHDTVEFRRENNQQAHEEEIYFQQSQMTKEELERAEYSNIAGFNKIVVKKEPEEPIVIQEEIEREEAVDVLQKQTDEISITEQTEEDFTDVSDDTNGSLVENDDSNRVYSQILRQEPDGQIALTVPESEYVEKQITGQLDLEQILSEWERIKSENATKRRLENEQRVMDHTSDILSEFDAVAKQEILAELSYEKSRETEDSLEDELQVVGEVEYQEELEESEDSKYQEELEELEDNEHQEELEELEDDEHQGEIEELEDDEHQEELEELEEDEYQEESLELEEDNDYQEESLEGVYEEEQEELADEYEYQEESLELEEDNAYQEESLEEVYEEENQEESRESEESDEPSVEHTSKHEIKPESEIDITEAVGTRRSFDRTQTVLFEAFVKLPKCREQIFDAIEGISLEAGVGNVIVTGESLEKNVKLAIRLVRELKQKNPDFSGKIGQVTAQQLNRKDISEVIGKLPNGALMIANAEYLNNHSINTMIKCVDKSEDGIVIFLHGVKHNLEKLLKRRKDLHNLFQLRVDVEEVNNDSLAKYGMQYAYNLEYGIDELGMLALHTRIASIQSNAHQATMIDVENIIKEAIGRAEQRSMAHFMDVLLGKRYDNEDMILLKEKDFVVN